MISDAYVALITRIESGPDTELMGNRLSAVAMILIFYRVALRELEPAAQVDIEVSVERSLAAAATNVGSETAIS